MGTIMILLLIALLMGLLIKAIITLSKFEGEIIRLNQSFLNETPHWQAYQSYALLTFRLATPITMYHTIQEFMSIVTVAGQVKGHLKQDCIQKELRGLAEKLSVYEKESESYKKTVMLQEMKNSTVRLKTYLEDCLVKKIQ